MKQKDFALIIVIAIVAGAMSLIVTRFMFVTPENRQQEVEVAEPISTSFNAPSAKYFNTNSINPTQNIEIGDSSNPQPFKGTN